MGVSVVVVMPSGIVSVVDIVGGLASIAPVDVCTVDGVLRTDIVCVIGTGVRLDCVTLIPNGDGINPTAIRA